MTALRLSPLITTATVGLLALAHPAPAAAQGRTAHACTAVNQVQVTVPPRLALNPSDPVAAVRANTAWRLEVSAAQAAPTTTTASLQSTVTEVRDNPGSPLAVRYTLVGS